MADRHGNLWIGTVGCGLCRLNAGKSESADKQPTFVLADMRSRVEKMGGECEIDSQIGKGTKIKATVPLKS